jgi:hypothetical protein
MTTPTVTQLRSESEALLRFQGESPVLQILAVALGQTNNGTQCDPNLTTDQYLDQIRTWQNQATSDVTAIIVNQLMRFLKNLTTLRAATPAITQLIAVGDLYTADVTVTGAKAGDFVLITPRTPVLGDFIATGYCVSDNTASIVIRNMSSIIGLNLVNNVFNIIVIPA